jgi:AraC-like DNA-binding protein
MMMEKKPTESETYSYASYSCGDEPLLDSICIERCRGDVYAQKHRSDAVRLVYILSGEGVLSVNGTQWDVKPGMLAKLFAYHIVGIKATSKNEPEYYICSFALSVLMYLDVQKKYIPVDPAAAEGGNCLVELSEDDALKVEMSFAEMEQECGRRQAYYLTAVLGNLLRTLSVFDRKAEQRYAEEGPAEISLAWRILQYMHMYFSREDMDAAAVAEKFGISPIRLVYLLRRLTGENFSENLHDARIRNACAMMHFEELSISYIARYVGYKSMATFCRTFKRVKGVTAGRYRCAMARSEPVNAHRDTAWKVLLYLMEHYQNNIRSANAAEHLFICEDTLAGICEVNFGLSFSELLEQIRLMYAGALLFLPQLKIRDIAAAVGFNTVSTFSRSFRKSFGTAPERFREMKARE